MADISSRRDSYEAVVVGAGWAGMYMLHRLRELGMTVRLFEEGEGVGGTWYWNRYPGARCDLPSLDYSYSFSEELQQEWNWSERYAAQPEIERYANHVAERFDLLRDIEFGARIASAEYDESNGQWLVKDAAGRGVRAKYLLLATGGYSVPIKPSIKGVDTFKGELYYTSRWPREDVKYAGKRIGIIGTGSSGMQTSTAIAQKDIDHLYVFMRTASYALPAQNRPLDAEFLREYKKTYTDRREASRQTGVGIHYSTPALMVRNMPEADFRRHMDAAWEVGGFAVIACVGDLLTDEVANARVGSYLRSRVRERVKDPVALETLTSNEHLVGVKRALVEIGYYEIYNKPNVTLVNLKKAPIEEITPTGIRTSDASYDLDMIILATGFDTGTGAALRINPKGKNGVSLSKKWAKGPATYLGLMVEGFPNLFFIAQPGSPSIRSQVLAAGEQQVEWLAKMFKDRKAQGWDTIEPALESEVAWTAHVDDVANSTLVTRHDSQYVGSNVPGKPRTYLCYVGGLNAYGGIIDSIRENNYEGFVRTSSGVPTGAVRQWSGPPQQGAKYSTVFGGRIV